MARLPEGKVVFVEGALPGERAAVRVYKQKPRLAIARVISIERPSAERREPRCPHFGVCGGCVLQHAEGALQLEAKRDGLEQSLARIGKTAPGRWLPSVQGEEWGYRRRARLSVRRVPEKGGVLVGFRERRSSYVANLRECSVLPDEISALIQIGRASCRERV